MNFFAGKYLEKLRNFFSGLQRARQRLENVNFVSGDLVFCITELRDLRDKHDSWVKEMDTFRNGQKLLDRQRFSYPTDWLYLDQIEGEWSNFKQILSRKTVQFDKESKVL